MFAFVGVVCVCTCVGLTVRLSLAPPAANTPATLGAPHASQVFAGKLQRDGDSIPVAIKVLKGSPDLLTYLKKELDVLKWVPGVGGTGVGG